MIPKRRTMGFETKTVDLQCDSCKQVVGSVKIVGDSIGMRGEGNMIEGQHLDDCPVVTAWVEDAIKALPE
jgi:hypothetical protein